MLPSLRAICLPAAELIKKLIAPDAVLFFDSDWLLFDTNEALKDNIKDITRIHHTIIDGSAQVQACSIACRMSWAANRQTTKIEGMAYCLLGIFDIQMPSLYGKGQAAFTRF
jgi:hypothetical protein